MRVSLVVLAGALVFANALPAVADSFLNETLRECRGAGDARRACDADAAQFRESYHLAFRRNYTGQRNVAFCLGDASQDGCHGAVVLNPIAACAWRMVVLASGSSEIDASDVLNYRVACGKKALTNAERASAINQAEAIFKKIYKREMPLRPILAANEGGQ